MKYYKLGARAPSDVIIPLGGDSYEAYETAQDIIERSREAYGLACDTPRVANSVLRGANFLAKRKGTTWNDYYHMGAESFDIEKTLKEQGKTLEQINKTAERDLFYRKVATGAAVAGALFAAVRLTDIWLAVKARRRLQ